MFKHLLIASLLAYSVGGVFAQGQERLSDLLKREMPVTDASLAECRTSDDKPIEEVRCGQWKRSLAKAYAEEKAIQTRASQTAAAHAAYESEQAAAMANRQVEQQRQQDARQAERERTKAEFDRTEAALEADERRQAAKATKASADLKSKCGADYKAPRIGMTMTRVKECVSPSFKVSGQINTAQGVVTTYKAPGGYLHVIDDKVVEWRYFHQ